MRRSTRAERSRRAPRPAHNAPALRARALLLSLFAALLCPYASRVAAAQTPATKGAAGASGSVAGRVTTSDGKPAANVAIALAFVEFTNERAHVAGRATTNEDGRYKIAGVAPGRYRLQALAPLYTSPDDAGRGGFDTGQPVNVSAGESVENIDVTLTRGGVITGRATTPEGRPVIGERIWVANAGQPGAVVNIGVVGGQLFNTFDFETDDRGVFRIYGVPPGRYVVSIGMPRSAGVVTFGQRPVQYQRTFYPGTTDVAQAKPVEVTSGGEATGVDITLAEAPLSYEARGRIVDEEGKPVAGVGYGYGGVQPNQQMIGPWGMDGTVTNDAGEFVLHNLVPGRYAVFASPTDYGATPVEFYSDATQFEVADENVEGLVVKVHRAASISGVVIMDGTTDRAVLSKITQLQVSAHTPPAQGMQQPAEQLTAPSFSQARVQPDGTFRLAGLRPGKLVITAYSGSVRNMTVLGVQREGADASAGFDVGEGEQVTGVRVHVGIGTGVIRGQLDLRSAGQPMALPPGARAGVVARRPGATQSPMVQSSEIDSRGHFVIEGLVGGEYELNLYVYSPPQPGVPFTRPQTTRQRVTVPDGGEVIVSIMLDLNPQTERNP